MLSPTDRLVAELIDSVMCQKQINLREMCARHPSRAAAIGEVAQSLLGRFPNALEHSDRVLKIKPGYEALARVIAAHMDHRLGVEDIHSLAI